MTILLRREVPTHTATPPPAAHSPPTTTDTASQQTTRRSRRVATRIPSCMPHCEGHVVDGIHLGRQRDQMIMSGRPRNRISGDQSEHGPDHADQHALKHEDATDLPPLGAHRDQHRDVARLLHHHHDQRDQNVQRGHKHDQADGDERNHALQPQCVEKRVVLLHPVGRHEALTGFGFQLAADFARLVDVVNLELQHRDHVTQIEEPLGVRRAE